MAKRVAFWIIAPVLLLNLAFAGSVVIACVASANGTPCHCPHAKPPADGGATTALVAACCDLQIQTRDATTATLTRAPAGADHDPVPVVFAAHVAIDGDVESSHHRVVIHNRGSPGISLPLLTPLRL